MTCCWDMQGDSLRWHMTPSHGYAIESLPGEVIAAGALAQDLWT